MAVPRNKGVSKPSATGTKSEMPNRPHPGMGKKKGSKKAKGGYG
jgi:hypothetical protein